ncbi:sugar phosphate isomerase/epimerase family protein [Paenibacillus radicis (ex Xue et al. 2023)]|uniref:Sugar phosphate isomerase/epimerase n=1 Tax=Paenibacillus radicis (ex Xue et al. 2023) TaxID=2972489 RepID=A0ABT1YQ71_9BACL|nr:sugar phosphate isomerase/epimerase [Paenibacillus radicis (ex Xue et al. 2023)]MCR8635327.1 sugar phosphate isomerase/epimerase [Paenibacillus radicis (ex Xue et al. 2023)]
MIVGLGEWGLQYRSIEDHCRIARNFDLRYLELGIGGDFPGRIQRDIGQQGIDDLLTCMKDYGIKAPFVALDNDFTIGGQEQLSKMKERVAHDIRLASRLNATHVRLFTGFELAAEMTEERWAWMLQAFVEMNDLCSEFGMVISIETHGRNTPVNNGFIHEHTTSTEWNSLQRLLKELPSTVGFNFDPGNLKAVDSSRPLADYAKLLGGRINYCHLKDWKQTDNYWVACAPGDDDLNYDELLKDVSFQGVYLIEYEQVDDVVEGIGRSLNYLRSIRPDLRIE